MIIVYCPRPSKGAVTLTDWFNDNGHVAVRARSANFQRLNPTLVIGWGEQVPTVRNVRVLNAQAGSINKLNQLQALARAGVSVPQTSRTQREGWLARRVSHQDGDDLRNPTGADYYTEMVPSTHEYRMNVFNGDVFRTGLKIPKRGVEAHPFIRTGSGGWTWTYDQDALNRTGRPESRRPFRDAAVAAVRALGYDFGAVDIGRRNSGGPVVYEVNSAPALENSDIARWGNLFLEYERSR